MVCGGETSPRLGSTRFIDEVLAAIYGLVPTVYVESGGHYVHGVCRLCVRVCVCARKL